MKNIFSVKNLNFIYTASGKTLDRNFFALRNLAFEIQEGDFISVIGKNGSGKSTLIKLLAGIITNYQGEIYFYNENVNSIGRKEFSKKVSYLPQSSVTFNESIKVRDFLLLGRYAYKKFTDFTDTKKDKQTVEDSIEITGISRLADNYIYELSGGEKQKVLLTLSVVQLNISESLSGKVLIIDEPLTYLDVKYQFEIFDILKRLREKGLTVIIVIHDLNLALRFSDKTILMKAGEIIEYTISRNVITEEILREHFEIESEILDFDKNRVVNYLHK